MMRMRQHYDNGKVNKKSKVKNVKHAAKVLNDFYKLTLLI